MSGLLAVAPAFGGRFELSINPLGLLTVTYREGEVVQEVLFGREETERIAEELAAFEVKAAEPCTAETPSWDHYSPDLIDSYWIRCTELGPHEKHRDSNTGLTWGRCRHEHTD